MSGARKVALSAVLFLIVGTPCAARAAAPEEEEATSLRLSMSGAFRPFSTTDVDGRLVGFDADMARAIAKRIGREAELVQIDWAGIQAGLESGKYDLICGSMAITAERLETMHFTLPYYVSGAQVFSRRGVFDLAGIRVGVTEDSTYAAWIADHPERFPDAEILAYGSEAEIVAAMNADKIDAFVSDRIVGGFYVKAGSAGDIVPHGDLLYREACGIAARHDSAALVREVNEALFSLLMDGTYARIYRKWVGADPDVGVLLSSWAEYWEHVPREGGSTTAKPAFAETVRQMVPMLLSGAWLTIRLSLITAILALLSGAIVGVGTVARAGWLRRLSGLYVWAVRGTPLLVQLFVSYFVVATAINRLVGAEIVGAFGAALLALVVNTTAYNAETLRGGIASVESGQWDAAASLGMRRSRILSRIVLPQAFRNALPSLGNNLVVLIKDTSLVGAITLIELTYAARNVMFQKGHAFLPFLAAAIFYLAIISFVSIGMGLLERRLGRSRAAVGSMI